MITEVANEQEDDAVNFEVSAGPFQYAASREGRDIFTKWGLLDRMVLERYRFTGKFKLDCLDDFLVNFFNDGTTRVHLPVSFLWLRSS